MGRRYETLLIIQDLDITSSNLKIEIESIPKEISELKKSNSREKKEVDDAKHNIKELTVKRRQIEKDPLKITGYPSFFSFKASS